MLAEMSPESLMINVLIATLNFIVCKIEMFMKLLIEIFMICVIKLHALPNQMCKYYLYTLFTLVLDTHIHYMYI